MITVNEKGFSARLAMLRTKKGVSARDMSLSMGQNPGYINNIESGKSYPSLSGIFYICDYLGISAAEFFDTGNEDPARLKSITEDLKHLNSRQLDALALFIKEIV